MAELTSTVILDGIVFPEGPRWHDGRLWFSDIHGHKVIAMTPAGEAETIAEVPERPSGLGFLPDGTLLIVSMQDGLLLRKETDGKLSTVADLTSFGSGGLNDMVVDGEGRAYVDVYGVGGDRRNGGIILVKPNGEVSLAVEGLTFPNGLVITQDGGTLIAAETMGHRLSAFDIGADGALSNQRVWAELGEVTPDGICVDSEDAVWVGSPFTGEFIRVRQGGEITDRVPTPGKWAVACALGGDDRRTLFLLTAETTMDDLFKHGKAIGWIETTQVPVPGAGWP
jgi:sugar lactone lactonase YvrE